MDADLPSDEPTRGRITGRAKPARKPLRVVLAHDFMECYGGAERVTAELAAAFPDAPVFAILGRGSVAERMGVADRFTPLFPAGETLFKHYRKLAPLFPALVDRVRLPEADVLLTSSYAFAHRLRTAGDAPQVCYLHSPLRFAWSQTTSYRRVWAPGALRGAAFEQLARRMRASDLKATARVDRFLTQSPYVADQVERFYGRTATVVGAPVDCRVFRPSHRPPEDFFLFCGRLIEPYKRVSLVLDAFARLRDRRVVIAGDGPAMAELRRRATPNVEFVGHVEDGALVELMQRCQATLFPSQDDFGLVPVEVMACGRPVIAYAGGGALHTIVPGTTGTLFAEQTAEALAAAVAAHDPARFDPWAIRLHALQWDRPVFQERLVEAVALAAQEARTPARAPVAATPAGPLVALPAATESAL